MYLCHNLNGDATQQIDARRRRGLVVADRVRTATLSAGGLTSFDICSRRRRHPSQRHACTMLAWASYYSVSYFFTGKSHISYLPLLFQLY